jgi:hypothetical protein
MKAEINYDNPVKMYYAIIVIIIIITFIIKIMYFIMH